MKKSSVFCCLLLTVLLSCGGEQVRDSQSDGSSASNTGQATGYATVFDNDLALARDRAIDDAKLKLVRKVLGETINGQSIMKDFELVSEIVTAKSIGLVKNDRIVKQWQDGNEYYVTIEGTVEPAAVEDAIEDILNTYGRPKFLVLVSETFDGKQNSPGFTETELLIQEIMGNSGFQFVDASLTQQLMKRDKSVMASVMNGSVNAEEQDLLLENAGAEVVIMGTVQTADQSNSVSSYSKNLKSKQAVIRLRAVDVYTGNIIASVSKNAPGAHIDEETASKKAIENCLKLVLGRTDPDTGKFRSAQFLDTVTSKFVKAASAREITLIIYGLDYRGLQDFRDRVEKRIRGVSSVTSKGLSEDTARIEVVFAGKTEDFADELLAKGELLGFDIEVKESFPNRLLISALKK